MFAEELFEGWLSVPSIESFLEMPPQSSTEHASKSATQYDDQEQTESDRLHPARAGSSHLSFTSDSVGADSGTTASRIISETPNDATVTNATNRKRRGHTKSRLGCINCKKRKIKCQETWPSCANCIRHGCPCRYPMVFKYTQHERLNSASFRGPRQIVRLSDTPESSTFDADDMRAFHHFLVTAHPGIPHENHEVWIREVPVLSHQYKYLMHGILAMSGSHLNILVENPSAKNPLMHRQKAIEGLEKAFTKWPLTSDEAHVMLATSYLLAFQSSYLPDGMLDHVLCLRGTALVSQMILEHNLEGAFSINPNMYGEWFELKMAHFPSLDQHLARDALSSIAKFAPHLAPFKPHRIERALLINLVESIRPLLVSLEQPQQDLPPKPEAPDTSGLLAAQDGIATLLLKNATPETLLKNPLLPLSMDIQFEDIKSWDNITEIPPGQPPNPYRHFYALMSTLLVLNTWPREDVLHLMSPTNMIGNILMAHFCSVRFIVAPLSAPEPAMRTPIKGMVEWFEKAIDAVEDDNEVKWSAYVEWPKKIATIMRCYLNQKKGLTFGDLHRVLMSDPQAFREGRMVKLSDEVKP